jgi:hypothetical protein
MRAGKSSSINNNLAVDRLAHKPRVGGSNPPATKILFPFSNIHEPRNHPNCQILKRLPLRGTGAVAP